MKKIGILCWEEERFGRRLIEVNDLFVQGIEKAGAMPICFPSITDEDLVKPFLSKVDGVVMTGGKDISPFLYGEEPIRELMEIQPKRDASELNFIREIFEEKIPLLAVCRGMQLVNVFKGGKLYQDIYSQRENSLVHSPKIEGYQENFHTIDIKEGSRLYDCIGDSVIVNSFHHQSIKQIGKDLEIVARAKDGIIEGIESKDPDHLFLGIQFHPEFYYHSNKFDRIFEYFVKEA